MKTDSKTISPLMMAVLTTALLALFAGGAWFYRFEKSVTMQRVEYQFAAIARLKVGQITAWRSERLGDAAVLSESPLLTAAAARYLADHDSVNAQELRSHFLSLQVHYRYTDVLMVDPEGKVLLTLSENSTTHTGYAAALAEALRERKPVFADLHTEAKHQTPHISMVAPIFAGEGQAARPLGAIILVNDATQFLYPLIQSWPTPSKTAETLLIRRDGDTALFLNDLRHQPNAALKLRIPLSKIDVPAVMAVLGREGFVEGRDYRGVPSVAVVLPIPDSPWFMVAKDDTAEVFAEWHFRAVLILGLFAALMVGLGAIGLVVWHSRRKTYYKILYDTEVRLRTSVERHSITLKSVGDGVIAIDAQGQVELLNPVAETLTGWSQEEACGRPLEDVFRIVNEETREKVENPAVKVLREGSVVSLANHTLLIARNGSEWPIADLAAPIQDIQGEITGVVLVFRDQTNERWAQRLIQVRFALLEYASTHTLDELLTKALDEIGTLVESPIGFYHFVNFDQKTLSLQQWSTRTLKEFCRAEGKGIHYGIDQAGVWADCAREGKPVIHNDYASLPHKKGMPAGHAEVIRELVVPVMKAGKMVAILGVGNKPADYTEKDIDTVSYLADVTWQLIDNKRTEEALQKSAMLFRNLFEHHAAVKLIINPKTGKIIAANRAAERFYGWSKTQLVQMKIQDINTLSPDQVKQEMKKARDLKRVSFEFRHRRSDGTIRDVAVFSSNINVKGKKLLHSIVHDITEEKKMEEALHSALEDIRTLRGIIPICANCKQIRDDQGYWNQVEVYIRDRTEAQFSHGICPTCVKKLYPDLDLDDPQGSGK
jgi:two-component system, cell cycle sensor histidine kinase and response regulator CckA